LHAPLPIGTKMWVLVIGILSYRIITNNALN
jgi:hypothetical protein